MTSMAPSVLVPPMLLGLVHTFMVECLLYLTMGLCNLIRDEYRDRGMQSLINLVGPKGKEQE
jgi:hypothetical protein